MFQATPWRPVRCPARIARRFIPYREYEHSGVERLERTRRGIGEENLELRSRIIRELNERFGTEFTEEDRVFIRQLEERLVNDAALNAGVLANPPENVRLAFDHVVCDRLQDMIETNFELYKHLTDDREFVDFFNDRLFERHLALTRKTKSKEGQPDPRKRITCQAERAA